MREFYPLLVIGGIVGTLTLCFVIAYATMKNKKEAIGFDRSMKDGELIRRLLRYANHIGPHFSSREPLCWHRLPTTL
ncbi:MAG: hypothetical protein IKC59_01805 [Clostridia bacterium]|nr:hypothetical protein [Clostridia bacterium]